MGEYAIIVRIESRYEKVIWLIGEFEVI